MNYLAFVVSLKQKMEEELGTDYRIRFQQIPKNNGQVRDSLTISKKGVNVSAAVYLQSYYQEYRSGVPFEEVARHFRNVCRMSCQNTEVDSSFFRDGNIVRRRLFPRRCWEILNFLSWLRISHRWQPTISPAAMSGITGLTSR